MPEYLLTEEVAELLRTTPDTVRFWRYRKIGPDAVKVGRRVLYPRESVDAWIDRARTAGTDQ